MFYVLRHKTYFQNISNYSNIKGYSNLILRGSKMTTYRIHGDNIVECERIADYIIGALDNAQKETHLISPSTIEYSLNFTYLSNTYNWNLVLLPGFNKAGRHRWEKNIFDTLKENGSFLSETPDAIVTKVDGDNEIILFAIEFCSALQAGNQAWQRSGRAYSTGKAGCPYIYIVDFVKYELDNTTRERKALRFPNPIVPYSYNAFSEKGNTFVAEAYIKSEEFLPEYDSKLKEFDKSIFAEIEISNYMIKKMCGICTDEEESSILNKNSRMIEFLSSLTAKNGTFSALDWKEILEEKRDIVNYSVEKNYFPFKKKIATKSQHGKSQKFQQLVEKYSIGIAAKDLPFGVIPKDKRKLFANDVEKLYPKFDKDTIKKLSKNDYNLVVCMIKGFKGRGDDNRPDRGLLPLISMVIKEKVDMMTYIYGPIIESNYKLLNGNLNKIAKASGFWKVILSINDYVIYDSKIISQEKDYDKEYLLDTATIKASLSVSNDTKLIQGKSFSSIPQEFHEDDVDAAIHYLFKHILGDVCFEGLCNPPGGDWSGISIIDEKKEKRWVSLPRENDNKAKSFIIKDVLKRPDHIIQLNNVMEKPVILSIESKENSKDLEDNVGDGLKNYIKHLMRFVPSVERNIDSSEWTIGNAVVNYDSFEVISVAAYLKKTAQDNETVFSKSNCDMLFILDPKDKGWHISIFAKNTIGKALKEYLCSKASGICAEIKFI